MPAQGDHRRAAVGQRIKPKKVPEKVSKKALKKVSKKVSTVSKKVSTVSKKVSNTLFLNFTADDKVKILKGVTRSGSISRRCGRSNDDTL